MADQLTQGAWTSRLQTQGQNGGGDHAWDISNLLCGLNGRNSGRVIGQQQKTPLLQRSTCDWSAAYNMYSRARGRMISRREGKRVHCRGGYRFSFSFSLSSHTSHTSHFTPPLSLPFEVRQHFPAFSLIPPPPPPPPSTDRVCTVTRRLITLPLFTPTSRSPS